MEEEKIDLSEDIKKLCIPLVSHPESISVTLTQDERKSQSYLILCDNGDIGKLIGRDGAISNSLRAIVNVSPKAQRKKISLKFDTNSKSCISEGCHRKVAFLMYYKSYSYYNNQ